jgi:hypothetical protein
MIPYCTQAVLYSTVLYSTVYRDYCTVSSGQPYNKTDRDRHERREPMPATGTALPATGSMRAVPLAVQVSVQESEPRLPSYLVRYSQLCLASYTHVHARQADAELATMVLAQKSNLRDKVTPRQASTHAGPSAIRHATT